MAKLSFQDFASAVSRSSGTPAAFVGCVALVIGWAVIGPLMGYSTGWLLVINTLSSIVTLLMVFLIQNSQTREGIAIQAKLNEIIRAVEAAENRFIGIERLTQNELVQIESDVHEAADAATARASEARV